MAKPKQKPAPKPLKNLMIHMPFEVWQRPAGHRLGIDPWEPEALYEYDRWYVSDVSRG